MSVLESDSDVHVSNTANRQRFGVLECIFCIERVKISSVQLVKVLGQALVVHPYVGQSESRKTSSLTETSLFSSNSYRILQ
jgi:hypothetical protein